MEIRTANELLKQAVPDIAFYWGDVLRGKGRISVIGKPKVAKSFFVMQMGLSIATGSEFLGMQTKKGTVLYVNFEISEEKLQERVQDMCSEMGITDVSNFLTVSISGGMALETEEGRKHLEEAIIEAGLEQGYPDVVILDPRRNSMAADENQSEILTKWCNNVDRLREEYGFTMVIVHHAGKSTIGAGRGSSVYDGWLDGMLFLDPDEGLNRVGNVRSKLSQGTLGIQSRDSESHTLAIEFNYLVWHLTEWQETQEKDKVSSCSEAILKWLSKSGEIPLGTLRLSMFKLRHTEYAYKRALKTLEVNNSISLRKNCLLQGNHKVVDLVTPKNVTRSPL